MSTSVVTSASLLLCHASTCLRMGSKLRCIRSTPSEMQSISENDFECFAGTGVHAPRTMFPDSSPMSVFQKPASVEPGSPRTFRVAASLDRKRLGADFWGGAQMSIRGVFDEEARRKPLAFAAGAGYAAGYGI
jgi:hypothetical protein